MNLSHRLTEKTVITQHPDAIMISFLYCTNGTRMFHTQAGKMMDEL